MIHNGLSVTFSTCYFSANGLLIFCTANDPKMILSLMQSKCDLMHFDLFFVAHCVFLSVCSVRFCGSLRQIRFSSRSRGAKPAVEFRGRSRSRGIGARACMIEHRGSR